MRHHSTTGVFLLSTTLAVVCIALPSSLNATSAENQPAKAAQLARVIVTSKKLSPALNATIEVIRRGGISVSRGGRVLVPGADPAVPERLDRVQAVYAAIEAQDRETAGNLTLRDFAALGAMFGAWPREKSDQFVVTLMNEWVKLSRANPTDVHSFVPAFLAQMASRQSPPVDLARPFKPGNVRITELEWALLFTAFERGVPFPRSRQSSPGEATDVPKKPCSQFDKVLKDLGYIDEKVIPFSGTAVNAAVSHILGQALKGAIDKWTRGDRDASKAMQNALKYAKIMLRVHSLYLFLKNSNIEVKPQENLVHKGLGRTVPFKMFAFAGLTEEAQRELDESGFNSAPIVRAARDCLKTAGIPIPEDLQDLAESMKGWRVRWSDFGRRSLAIPNPQRSKFKYPGGWMDELTKTAGSERYSVLEVDIQDENRNWHRPNDPDYILIRDPWYVTAELESSKPPDISKIKGIMEKTAGGIRDPEDVWDALDYRRALVDAITDILANWARTFVKPRAQGWVMVEQHVPCTTKTTERRLAAVMQNTCGPPRAWVGEVSGEEKYCCDGRNLTATWHANVRFALKNATERPESRTWSYEAVTGRVQWSAAGKEGFGDYVCNVQGQGNTPIVDSGKPGSQKAVLGSLNLWRKGDRYSHIMMLTGIPDEAVSVTKACPDGTGRVTQSYVTAVLPYVDRPWDRRNRTLAGAVDFGGGDHSKVHVEWRFTAAD